MFWGLFLLLEPSGVYSFLFFCKQFRLTFLRIFILSFVSKAIEQPTPAMLEEERRRPTRTSPGAPVTEYNQVPASVAPFEISNRSTWKFLFSCAFYFLVI